MIMCEWSVFC